MKAVSEQVHIPLVLTEAKAAESASDFDGLRDALFPVWPDTSIDPDFTIYGGVDRAELLRLSGHFLNQAGRAHKLKDYQLRAANLLTTASEIFQAEGDKDRWADSQVLLANCYLYQGDVDTFDLFLKSITTEFTPEHPASIRINTHKILALNERGSYVETEPFLRAVHPVIAGAAPKLQIQFHDAAGITMCGLGDHARGVLHFEEELAIAKATDNRHSASLALNQLAMAHTRLRDFSTAHMYVNQAVSIATAGWLPHFLDTRATIHLAEGRLSDALESVENAIFLFTDSGDVSGLAAAMFTKCKVELRTDDIKAAVTFAEVGELVRREMDEKTLRRYEKLLADEIKAVQLEVEKESQRIYCVTVDNEIAYRIPGMGIVKPEHPELRFPGLTLLYEHEKELKIGRIEYDDEYNLYLIGDDMLSPDDVKVIGVVP